MDKRKILHIILWVAALVCFGLTIWSYLDWKASGAQADHLSRFYWMIWCGIGVICIAIWYFTREEEEEVSITRAN